MTMLDADLSNLNALLLQEGFTDEEQRARALKDPGIIKCLALILQAQDIHEAAEAIEPLDVHYKSGILSSKEKLQSIDISAIRAALKVRMVRI